MTDAPELSFAVLLRQLRVEARLTQEELAEAAGLSPRSVSDLERGINRTARKDTALLLADALNLAEPVRVLFVAAARGRAPAAEVLALLGDATRAFAAATRGLPRDVAIFTGRQAELARLVETLSAAIGNGAVIAIHAIGGMAGVGKTTFAVHAAHELAWAFPDGQFFLPLHAHTVGQRPVDPSDALASLLLTAGVAAPQIPPGLAARAARWRDHVAGRKILLLLDDAAGHEQVRPLLPGTHDSLVLVTSRRRLAALPDAGMISLDTLPPGDAAELLARMAGRQELTADSSPALEIARLCGGLPLAIGMLASRLRHHPARTAAGLAADLASARDRLSLMRAEDLTVTAAFDLSYQELSTEQQRLFRLLGLIPGPDTDSYAAAALADIGIDQASRLLDELYDQHLLCEADAGRYQMHDLVREHARTLAAAAEPADSSAATARLLDYYLHTVLSAGQHFASRISGYDRPSGGRIPVYAPDLSTLAQSAAWLESERPNLHAAADYAAATGHHRHAIQIPGALAGFLAARGRFDESSALLRTSLAAARDAGNRLGEADALRELGIVQEETGDYQRALACLAHAVAGYQEAGERSYLTHALIELGFVRTMTGGYPGAAHSLRQALALACDAGDRLAEATALSYLGFLQQLTGDHKAAIASQEQSLELFRDLGNVQGQAHALNSLGMAQQETGDYQVSAANQRLALQLFRDLGYRPGEAFTLNDLGIVQRETGDYQAAYASHRQALALFREFGSRVQEAEALNRLGVLSSRTLATHQAREYHVQALAISRELGVPLEEARALEGIGQSYRQGGDLAEAARNLRQALTIYQRIGAIDAQHLERFLADHF